MVLAEVTIGPAVDFNPFPAPARLSATDAALSKKVILTPAETNADLLDERSQASKDELLRELARKDLPPGGRRIVEQQYQTAFGEAPPVAPNGNRGTQISAEMRQSRPKAVVFQNSKETKPTITIGEPVDFDPFAAPTAEHGEFAKGAIGGLTGGNPKMFGAAVQGLGTIAKSDWLKAQGESLRQIGEEQLKGYKPTVGSIADVRTDSIGNALGDFFTKYLPYQAGNAVASMTPTIVSGLIGAGVGTVAAGPAGAVAGGLAGTVLSGYPMNYGDIYSDALDDKGIQQAVKDGKLTDQDVAKITALAAIPITALDSWSISKLGGALLKDAKSALYKRIFTEMVSGGLREGATEGLQQILSEFTQGQMGGDKSLKEQAVAVVDNAIGGMAGGGLTGGAGGALQRSAAKPIAPAEAATTAVGLLPPAQQPVKIVFPDGSTINGQQELDAYIAKFPESERVSVRAKLLGMGQQEATAEQPVQEALSPIDQARADAQTLKQGGAIEDESRLKNATLIAVYGENAAVRHVIDAPDQFSAIADAMLSAAPTVERVKSTLGGNIDPAEDFVGAIDDLARIVDSGQSVAEVMAHIVPHDISYEGQQAIQFLAENIHNPAAIAGFLENVLHEVERAGGIPSKVRGLALDIFEKRQAAKQAETEEKATAQRDKDFKEREFKLKEAKLKTAEIANEQHRAELALQHIANAKASGSGLNPEHTTTMEHAFANAKKLKDKHAKPGDSGIPPATPSTPQKPSGGSQAKAGHDAGTVSQPLKTDNQSDARRNGAEGNRGGAAQKSNRGQAIAVEHGTRKNPVQASNSEHIATAAARAEPLPSPAQIGADVARKGHFEFAEGHPLRAIGMVSIETAKGVKRVHKDGLWTSPPLPNHYGHLQIARGADGDKADITIGDDLAAQSVYVIDQINPKSGKFDETKSFAAFPSKKAAIASYLASFSDNAKRRIGAVTEMPVEQFVQLARSDNLDKAVAYKKPAVPKMAEIPADLDITLQVEVADTGESMPVTMNARKAYREAEKRVNRLTSLLDCLS